MIEPSGNDSVVSKLSATDKGRIVLKRFVFSRQGQMIYLIVIGLMMILSCGLVLFSLISQTVRRSEHHVYRRIFWVQTLEAFVDFTFLAEVLGRAFILGPLFWQSALSYVDLMIALGCVVTFFLYNFYPDHGDSESENAESIIYITRQSIRFVRCVYFFMWFSDSFVQFKHNEEEFSEDHPPTISSSLDLRNPSRMASPFVTPLASPQVKNLQDMGDFDDASTDFSLGESASQRVRDLDSEESGALSNDVRERRIVQNLALLIDSPLSWDTGDGYYDSQEKVPDERTPLVLPHHQVEGISTSRSTATTSDGMNKKKLSRRYESF